MANATLLLSTANASTLVSPPDAYSQVSSLYGPGTTTCWYLTVLSCLVSWTIHPRKRTSDSVDPDLIAMLMFPAVASGHLVVQAMSFATQPADHAATVPAPTHPDINYLQVARSIEASLNVTETSMAIMTIALIVSLFFRSVKRTVLIASVGLFSVCAENYFSGVLPNLRAAMDTMVLHRKFLTDYNALLLTIDVAVGLLLVLCVAATVVFLTSQTRSTVLPTNTATIAITSSSKAFMQTKHMRSWTFLSYMLLPISLVMSMTPLADASAACTASATSPHATWGTPLPEFGKRVLRNIVPRSGVRMSDLDQAVAVLAGAIVLSFSLFSAASAHYASWSAKKQRLERERRDEAVWLRRLRLPQHDG